MAKKIEFNETGATWEFLLKRAHLLQVSDAEREFLQTKRDWNHLKTTKQRNYLDAIKNRALKTLGISQERFQAEIGEVQETPADRKQGQENTAKPAATDDWQPGFLDKHLWMIEYHQHKLTGAAKALLDVLLDKAEFGQDTVKASKHYFMARTGYGESSIKTASHWLHKYVYCDFEMSNGGNNQWNSYRNMLKYAKAEFGDIRTKYDAFKDEMRERNRSTYRPVPDENEQRNRSTYRPVPDVEGVSTLTGSEREPVNRLTGSDAGTGQQADPAFHPSWDHQGTIPSSRRALRARAAVEDGGDGRGAGASSHKRDATRDPGQGTRAAVSDRRQDTGQQEDTDREPNRKREQEPDRANRPLRFTGGYQEAVTRRAAELDRAQLERTRSAARPGDEDTAESSAVWHTDPEFERAAVKLEPTRKGSYGDRIRRLR